MPVTPRFLGGATLNSTLTTPIYTCPAATTTRLEHLIISNGSTAGTVTVSKQDVVGVTNKALTSNVATLTTSRPHTVRVGESITVSGVDGTFDGTYTVTAVTSTTISYSKTNANIPSASATGTVARPAIELLNAYPITANGVVELFNLILEAGDILQAGAATTTGAKITLFGAEQT